MRHIAVRTLFLTFIFFGANTMAGDAAEQSFSADPNVQKIAEAYAQDAADLSAKQFGSKLDWSDGSIATVERELAQLSASYATTNPKPTDEQVMSFAKAYGSYIGEVYRRNHGATWGIVNLNGQKFPGLRTTSGVNFWPWGRALNRIKTGAEDNVLDYYSALVTTKQK
jgi:hypothetical protein